MKKRFYFECWNCERTYSLFKEITRQQELIVACPFCNKEGVVKLEPYRTAIHPVAKGEPGEAQEAGYEYQLPNVIPTQKPD